MFGFTTAYNQKAMTTMARALRKTVRKKHSCRMKIFGGIILLLILLLSIPLDGEQLVIDTSKVITWLAGLIMIIVLIFEDRLNGYVARKRNLKGMDKSNTSFEEEFFISETEVGKTEWKYGSILELVETDAYFVFIYDYSHAQVYDKSSLSGGTVEAFRAFISEKTGKPLRRI